MVDGLIRAQRSAELLGHHQPMLGNVIFASRQVTQSRWDDNVAVSVAQPSAVARTFEGNIGAYVTQP
jgi:hypothetical protein